MRCNAIHFQVKILQPVALHNIQIITQITDYDYGNTRTLESSFGCGHEKLMAGVISIRTLTIQSDLWQKGIK
jgi:hypothetical protein